MKGIRRIRQRLCALPLALACLAGLAACGGPDFGSFSKELTFGDKQISDTQTTPYSSMKALERMPVQSSSTPNRMGRMKPPMPPARPTMPLMAPMFPG